MPNASIGSDIIVGFPGETDADFAQLASYLERSPLSHIHVFPYSDRPGTAASVLPDKIHGAVVRDRARQIREIGATLSQRFRAAQLGTLHRALTIDDGSMVVTGNYLKVGIDPGRARNEWVDVRISQVEPVMFGAVESGAPGEPRRLAVKREGRKLLAG
jgi:threonylcarbamoyladenosine tRNA methylthiotransferase MtaB